MDQDLGHGFFGASVSRGELEFFIILLRAFIIDGDSVERSGGTKPQVGTTPLGDLELGKDSIGSGTYYITSYRCNV